MARQDERERVHRQLGGYPGGGRRDDSGIDAPHPDTALTDDDDGVRTPRWLDAGPGAPTWRERLIPPRFRGARLDPGRRGVATMAGVGLLAFLITLVVVFWERPVAQPVPPLPAAHPAALPADAVPAPATARAPVEPETAPGPPPPAELVVSVVGLVHRTGLVRLPPGARVADALDAAGGALSGADLTGLNLAQRLVDGDQVRVGPTDTATPPPGSATMSEGSAAAADPDTGGAGSPAGAQVNLNTATQTDLDALPGVGPVTAKAIIAWRQTNGRFTDVEQLAEIDGIGPARLARLREMVTI
ncbi:ComEA family DNA-binding protein [Nocardia speluncae]|uniref:ComEA family DNA-binding protein n=1 Tax=Nocardia speluncae TaxID=419477 RepID=A0A846XFF8_9NOCA|nr:ComEA family DNA-binding protein [Nocardia speluncae]NKY34682.1 ComEA family DNA-binding protein [Nocardia speluncae]